MENKLDVEMEKHKVRMDEIVYRVINEQMSEKFE